MELSVLVEFGVAFVLLIVFQMAALVVDKRPFSIFSVSAVFLTLNVLPLVWTAFITDPELQQSFRDLIGRAHENTQRQLTAVSLGEDTTEAGLAGQLSSLKRRRQERRARHAEGGDEVKEDAEAEAEAEETRAAEAAASSYAHLVGDLFTIQEGRGVRGCGAGWVWMARARCRLHLRALSGRPLPQPPAPSRSSRSCSGSWTR